MHKEAFKHIHSIMGDVGLGWPPSTEHNFSTEMYPAQIGNESVLRVCLYHWNKDRMLQKCNEVSTLFKKDSKIEVVAQDSSPAPKYNVKPFAIWDIRYARNKESLNMRSAVFTEDEFATVQKYIQALTALCALTKEPKLVALTKESEYIFREMHKLRDRKDPKILMLVERFLRVQDSSYIPPGTVLNDIVNKMQQGTEGEDDE